MNPLDKLSAHSPAQDVYQSMLPMTGPSMPIWMLASIALGILLVGMGMRVLSTGKIPFFLLPFYALYDKRARHNQVRTEIISKHPIR